MTQEVYKIVITHYMQDDKGNRMTLDEPIVCQNIYDRTFGSPVVLLNNMLDRIKEFVLRKAAWNETD